MDGGKKALDKRAKPRYNSTNASALRRWSAVPKSFGSKAQFLDATESLGCMRSARAGSKDPAETMQSSGCHSHSSDPRVRAAASASRSSRRRNDGRDPVQRSLLAMDAVPPERRGAAETRHTAASAKALRCWRRSRGAQAIHRRATKAEILASRERSQGSKAGHGSNASPDHRRVNAVRGGNQAVEKRSEAETGSMRADAKALRGQRIGWNASGDAPKPVHGS